MRVDASEQASTALTPSQRWAAMYGVVSELDDCAAWDGETTILLSNGNTLTHMSHVRAYLESHPAGNGEWPPW